MEDGQRWQYRAAEMRAKAAQSKEPFIIDGFLALAAEYERLAEEGARWTGPSIAAHHPMAHDVHPVMQPSATGSGFGRPAARASRS
jgi:hypothetical protein